MPLHEDEKNIYANNSEPTKEGEEVEKMQDDVFEPGNVDDFVREEKDDKDQRMGAENDKYNKYVLEIEDQKPGNREPIKMPITGKREQPSVENKSILRLQEQLNKHLHTSKRTEDILKQIQRKLLQIDKIAIISNKQHESIRKMQIQFNYIQRTITKLDKSITGRRSKGSLKSKPSVKVDKKNMNKKNKTLKKRSSRIR